MSIVNKEERTNLITNAQFDISELDDFEVLCVCTGTCVAARCGVE